MSPVFPLPSPSLPGIDLHIKIQKLTNQAQPQPGTSDVFTILIYSWVSIMFLQTSLSPYRLPGSPLLPTDTLH